MSDRNADQRRTRERELNRLRVERWRWIRANPPPPPAVPPPPALYLRFIWPRVIVGIILGIPGYGLADLPMRVQRLQFRAASKIQLRVRVKRRLRRNATLAAEEEAATQLQDAINAAAAAHAAYTPVVRTAHVEYLRPKMVVGREFTLPYHHSHLGKKGVVGSGGLQEGLHLVTCRVTGVSLDGLMLGEAGIPGVWQNRRVDDVCESVCVCNLTTIECYPCRILAACGELKDVVAISEKRVRM